MILTRGNLYRALSGDSIFILEQGESLINERWPINCDQELMVHRHTSEVIPMFIYTNILKVFLTKLYPLVYVRTLARVPPVTLTCAIVVIQPWALNEYIWQLYGGHDTLPLHGDT